jgi:hypothetical protein
MPQTIGPPQPGRPKRHPIDSLRTRVWLAAVKARSGLPSTYAIELALQPELVRRHHDGLQRPRKWDAYEAGRRVPRRMAGKPYAVDLAESRFPGTAAYFDSPLWPILRGERTDTRTIERQLASLDRSVTQVLFERDVVPGQKPAPTRRFNLDAACWLGALGSFDALVAAVLLMTKAELIASPDLRQFAMEAYLDMQPEVAVLPEVAPVADELFDAIDSTCKHWLYLRPDERQEMVVFSNEIRRKTGRVGPVELQAIEKMMRLMMSNTPVDAFQSAKTPPDTAGNSD